MLKLADLANRADFAAGPLHVSPGRRLIEGPAGKASVEPIVMKVFLLLIDARGSVVTRDELFANAWGGVFVGDDSLNRAIARVRKIAGETAPGLFEIETIPRTGYRLTGQILDHLQRERPHEREAAAASTLNRRVVLSGAAAAAAAGAAALWWIKERPESDEFAALMARGDEALRDGSAFDQPRTSRARDRSSPQRGGVLGSTDADSPIIQLYEKAVQLRPRSAKAWGLLGYFRAMAFESGAPRQPDRFVRTTQTAIERALALDPNEPNALTASFLLNGPMMDWPTRDARLQAILAAAPDNIPALSELMTLRQAAGYNRESWRLNERILELAPLLRPHLVIRALKLWILGNVAESDRVIDRVRALWPNYDFAYSRRLLLFAVTGRPRAAHTMLDSAPDMVGPPSQVELWRTALDALETRTPAAVERARAACLDAARETPWAVNVTVILLCALGLKETAFEITDGYLLWRGKHISTNQADGNVVNDYSRRMTQWLFTPPCAILRADPRFLQLCEEFGLAAYWRARNVRPDYQLREV
ncbi:MAG TPA: winged helix-turn-helix domain-containing protein [Sphingomicrobium sp.]|nr:winged helix-turn-helix domain-containing protein [Sphingomicrobium sp.]